MSWLLAEDWRAADLLPGCYLVALVFATGWLLRHFDEALPRRVWLILGTIILILFGPVLFGGRVFLPLEILRGSPPYHNLPPSQPGGHPHQSDLIREIAPHLFQVRRAYSAGEWPLWNDLVGAGMPILADPQTQALQPLVLLGLAFPVVQAVGVTAALRVAVCFLFLFLLLRRLGVHEPAAILGTTSYSLGGAVLPWLGWPLVNAMVLLPAALYGLTLVVDVGRRRDAALLTAVLFALLVGGQPEVGLYALAVCAVFTVERLRAKASKKWGALVRVLSALAIAVALASPALLSAHDYLPRTQRAKALEAAFGTRSVHEAIANITSPEVLAAWRQRATQRFVGLVAPRAWGDYVSYHGETNLIEDGAGFVGSGGLLLAIVLLLGRGSTRNELWLIVILAICLALLFQPPGFDVLTHHLPLVGFTAAHKHRRLLFVIGLCTAWLAALCSMRWHNTRRQRLVLTGGALGLAGLLTGIYVAVAPETGSPIGSVLTSRWLLLQVAAVGATALFLGLQRRTGHARWAIAAVIGCELLVSHLPSNVPNARHLAFPTTPGLRFLQEHIGTARMVALGRIFPANTPSALGLADVRISNASEPEAYAAATQLLRLRGWVTWGRVQHPLYDLLGVRWVAARPDTKLELPRAYAGSDLWVFERPSACPRVFLAESIPGSLDRAAPDAHGVGTCRYARPSSTLPGRDKLSADQTPLGRLEIANLTATRVTAKAQVSEKRLVVTTLYQDGSWRLLLNQQVHPTVTAEGPFLATWIPAGTHLLDLSYRPTALVIGLFLAAVASAGALAWWTPKPR